MAGKEERPKLYPNSIFFNLFQIEAFATIILQGMFLEAQPVVNVSNNYKRAL